MLVMKSSPTTCIAVGSNQHIASSSDLLQLFLFSVTDHIFRLLSLENFNWGSCSPLNRILLFKYGKAAFTLSGSVKGLPLTLQPAKQWNRRQIKWSLKQITSALNMKGQLAISSTCRRFCSFAQSVNYFFQDIVSMAGNSHLQFWAY